MEDAGPIRTDRTVLNASIVAAQRALIVLSGVLTASLIPRTFGPTACGQFALLTSVALWFGLLSEPGLAPALSRYVAANVPRGNYSTLLGLSALRLEFAAMESGL